MRPHGSPGILEERRHKIIAFLKRNLSLHEIARRIGFVSERTVRYRLDRLRQRGINVHDQIIHRFVRNGRRAIGAVGGAGADHDIHWPVGTDD